MKGLGTGDHQGEGGDVSAALARLNFGVQDLNRQLKQEVRVDMSFPTAPLELITSVTLQITKHHSSLLLQAASLGGLGSDLTEVRDKLAQVEGGVSKCVPSLSFELRTASANARAISTVSARRSPSPMPPSPPPSPSSPDSDALHPSLDALLASPSSLAGSKGRWQRLMES
jgi:hypothetical protein